MEEEDQQILEWLDEYFASPRHKKSLVSVLLDLQKEFGYLAKPAMLRVAEKMGLSPANVYGVATFYNQFRFVPPGKYPLKVCMGTACYIKQAKKIMEHFELRLGIEEGGVTEDREYSLDRVACVGCCTLAPVVLVGDEVVGDMSPTKVDGMILQHDLQRKQQEDQAAGEEKDEGSK